MQDKNEVYSMIKEVLVEMFELESEEVTPDANLYEDLDIDSIDAVDLVVRLKEETGKKLQPEEFKSVRTVNDVVDAIYQLMQ